MKIFLFNPENGFYLGEDFADEAPMAPGAFVIPPDATTIAPPCPGPGQVAVFNTGKRLWEVHLRCDYASTGADNGQRSRDIHGEVDR